jgi:phosphate starvation-inducible protein PhoH and related proteins
MSKTSRRRGKLSEEELEEVQNFVYRKNAEEDKFLQSMSVNIKCKNENQKLVVESIKNNEITIVSGLPGTGKTFLACAEALKLIKTRPKYKKILLVKSVIQLPGEELGFLPGDLKDKLDPYMISFIDNFEKIIGESLTNKLRELGLIQIQPLAFVRGRSIDNTIIIVDEAQNISIQNMRTLMTRIGDNSKMVILGDVKQKDIKNPKNSSLEVVIDKFKGIDGFGCVSLRNPDDIVRNPIIKIIEKVFEELEG